MLRSVQQVSEQATEYVAVTIYVCFEYRNSDSRILEHDLPQH